MDKHNRRSTVSGGIFLIGLGVLAYTGWWWPGIMLIIGLASSAELILRGKYLYALFTFGFFAAIPLLIATDIPWHIFGPLALIALGIAAIVRNMSRRHLVNVPPAD